MALYQAPNIIWKSNLDGRFASTDATLTVISATGLVAPGIIVINRQDGQGNNTHDIMEFCSFTGISSNTLTGVTRGLGGSSARNHNSGALVENFVTVTHWIDLLSFLQEEHEDDGEVATLTHAKSLTFTGVSGLSGIKGDTVLVAGSGITLYPVSGISGHNYIGINMAVGRNLPLLSLATLLVPETTNIVRTIVPETVSIKSISAVLKSPSSNVTIVLDINKNFSTLFTNQNTRIMFPIGGTLVSTASIGVLSLTAGDIISVDNDTTT